MTNNKQTGNICSNTAQQIASLISQSLSLSSSSGSGAAAINASSFATSASLSPNSRSTAVKASIQSVYVVCVVVDDMSEMKYVLKV